MGFQLEEKPEDPGLLHKIGTGALGALNSVGFGIPEAIARLATGDEAVNQWIKDRGDAWNVGSTVGDIGSFLIPGGAIAKGLGKGAKLVGLGKAAGALDKFGDIAKGTKAVGKSPIVSKAIQGAAGALEQGIPRALASSVNEDPETALQNLATGTALGGALGGGLGVIGQGLGKFARRGAEQVGEFAEKAKAGTARVLGLDKRALLNDLQRNTPMGIRGNKADTQIQKSIDRIVALADDKDLRLFTEAGRGGRIEQRLADLGAKYDDLLVGTFKRDPALTDLVRGNIRNEIAGVKISPDFDLFDDAAKKVFDDVADQVDNYLTKPGGIANMRQAFDGKIRNLQKIRAGGGASDTVEAQLSAYTAARNALDNVVEEVSGGDLGKLGEEYRAMKMLSAANARGKLGDLGFGAMGGGSPTFEKAGLERMLAGGGLGAAVGLSSADWENDPAGSIARLLAASAGGAAINKGLPKLTQRAMPAVSKLAGKAETALNKIADTAGDAGVNIDPRLYRQAGAAGAGGAELMGDLSAPQEAMQETEPVDQGAQIEQALVQRLAQKWTAQNSAYGPADPSNPYFSQWAGQALSQATAGGQVDPVIAGKILADTPEQAKAVASALRARQAIDTQTGIAEQRQGGFLGIGQTPTDEAQIAQSLVGGALGDVAQPTGVTQKQVDTAARGIMAGGGTQEEKKAKLLKLLQTYSPQAYAMLQQAGAI